MPAQPENKRRCLDSSGNIYPAIATREYPQIYRLTVILITGVFPDCLRQAVKETLPYFPVFSVLLKRERHWYYLEQTEKMPEIRQMTDGRIRPFSQWEMPFRFLYEQNRIHLEVFHGLTDGCGAMHFLHAVCYRYCQLVYPGILSEKVRTRPYGIAGMNQIQDGYRRITEKKGSFWKILGRRRPFCIPGLRKGHVSETVRTICQPVGRHQETYVPEPLRYKESYDPAALGHKADVTTLRVPLPRFKKLCQAYHAIVCEMLAAVCMYILWKEFGSEASFSDRPLRIAVPVDLRPVFQEKTESNFFFLYLHRSGS